MPLNTPYPNPLRSYVDNSTSPSMSIDGLVVDGVYAINGVLNQIPTATPNVAYSTPEIGILNNPAAPTLPKLNPLNSQGWLSPVDYGGSTASTNIQITLDFPTYINHIRFDIYNVPCSWSLWYQTSNSSIFVPVVDRFGNPVSGVISGSSDIVALYNSNANGSPTTTSWINYDFDLTTFNTSILEIRINRVVPVTLIPIALQNSFTTSSYPIGMRNCSLLMNAVDWSDTFPIDKTESRESILGLTEEYSIYQNPGGDIVSELGYWKSSPQPVKDAVVCVYIDNRDSGENPQIIDGFYLDPLYSGNKMNVYYSSDDTIGSPFHMSRNRSNFTQDGTYGVSITSNGALLGSFVNNTEAAYLSIANSEVSLTTTNPFCIGLTFDPFSGYSSTSTYNLWSLGFNSGNSLEVSIIDNVVELSYYRSGTPTLIGDYPLPSNITSASTPVQIIVGWSGNSWVFYVNTVMNFFESSTYDSTETYDDPGVLYDAIPTSVDSEIQAEIISTFNVGSGTGGTNNGYFSNVWIRQDEPVESLAVQYYSDPETFMDISGTFDITRADYNGLLLARLTIDSSAYVGPGSDWFGAKSWTPLQRDFSLQKGYYSIPQINAKYLKLEITNLSVQSYLFGEEDILRTVQVFPDWVINYHQVIQSEAENAVSYQISTFGLYDGINQSGRPYRVLPTSNIFGQAADFLDSTSLVWPSTAALNASQAGSSAWTFPNDVTYVKDPTYSINSLNTNNSSLYENDNQINLWMIPRFPYTGTHQYKYITVDQNWKQSYFAGIRALQLYRNSHKYVSDSSEYLDNCFNDAGSLINSSLSTMAYTPDVGFVSQAINEQVVTENLPSFSNVEALQLSGITSDWQTGLTDQQVLLQDTSRIVYENTTQVVSPVSNAISVVPTIASRIGNYWSFAEAVGSTKTIDQLSGNDLSHVSNGGTVTFGESSIWPVESQTSTLISGGDYFNSSVIPVYNSYSILVTIEPTSNAGIICAFNNTGIVSGTTSQALYLDNSNYLNYSIELTNSTILHLESLNAVTLNVPHRIAISYNYSPSTSTTTASLYLDGVLQKTASASYGPSLTSSQYLVVGNGSLTGLPNAGTTSLTAKISELIYVNESINSTQVTNDALGILPFSSYGISTTTANSESENLLIPNDANFYTGIGNWVSLQNAESPLVTSTAYYQGGSPNSLDVAVTANGNAVVGIGSPYVITNVPGVFIPAYGAFPYGSEDYGGGIGIASQNASQTYTWALSVLAGSVARDVQLEVIYSDSNQNPIATITSTAVTEIVGQWVKLSVTSTTPQGAYFVTINLIVNGAVSGEHHYVSEVGFYQGTQSTWVPPINFTNMRVSAVSRIYIPTSSYGIYEIRLKSDGQIVSRTQYKGVPNTWIDMETIYYTDSISNNKFQAEVVQIDPTVNEPFAIGFLGYFYHPIRWEISSDDGQTWKPVVSIINDPNGFTTLPSTSNQFQIRLTALQVGVFVRSIFARPRYSQSAVTPLADISYYPDPLTNEQNGLRATKRMPMFQLSSSYYPSRFISVLEGQ